LDVFIGKINQQKHSFTNVKRSNLFSRMSLPIKTLKNMNP
jgi:hypothetical protein